MKVMKGFMDKMTLTKYAQSCFLIETEGKKILIDPGNVVDENMLLLMHRAGCINIAFGLESGSKTILKEMDKNCNLEYHYKMLKYCHRIGIRATLAWLSGTPSESHFTLEESKKYYLAANKYQYRPTIINKMIPVPGTRLFEYSLREGKIKDTLEYIKSFEVMEAITEDALDNVPNLTNMESSEFNKKIIEIRNELILDHKKRYSTIRRIMNISGLDHVNWGMAFRKFRLADIRPLFEAFVWSVFNRKNKFAKIICEKIIYGRVSNSKPLVSERDSTRD